MCGNPLMANRLDVVRSPSTRQNRQSENTLQKNPWRNGCGFGSDDGLELSAWTRYLPPEIAEQDAEESQAREPLILKLLSRRSTHLNLRVPWGMKDRPVLVLKRQHLLQSFGKLIQLGFKPFFLHDFFSGKNPYSATTPYHSHLFTNRAEKTHTFETISR